MRHTAAHILAEAVLSLFPEAKLGIGPPTEDGFFYDFLLPRSLTPDDLPKIEAKMREIIAQDKPLERMEIPKEEARRIFADQPLKLEILEEIPEETVTVYRQGEFVDLCQGPHMPSTGWVKAFKLLSVSGAYWRGDERRPMLQRIYGTAFRTEEELQAYLKFLEEAAERDHRKLGRELDLFSFHEEAGPGLVFWHPKGALLRSIIEDFWKREHLKRGYELVYTPHIAKAQLWKLSGHWEFYRENMYPPMDAGGQEYLVKPMNCPGHILIYKTRLRSYRELPLRWAELGTVYRWERSGVLHGLTRVRGFTQDDAHIFCRPDQLEEELLGVLDFALYMLRAFGFEDYKIVLSTRPEVFAGSPESWERATSALERALREREISYEVEPGEGVFYGPKIDILLKDALGREWQSSTIQVDFVLPERFDVSFVGSDGREQRAVMIHRALLGSMERFIGCLLEHYRGALPVWLSPVQVAVIPVAERHLEAANRIARRLAEEEIRVWVDGRDETVRFKIRYSQLQKIPYMIVLGDEEIRRGDLSVRTRTGETKRVSLEDLIRSVKTAVERRICTSIPL